VEKPFYFSLRGFTGFGLIPPHQEILLSQTGFLIFLLGIAFSYLLAGEFRACERDQGTFEESSLDLQTFLICFWLYSALVYARKPAFSPMMTKMY